MTRRIVTAVARIDDLCEAVIDCPPAHTMYLDKPLARHNLMRAIARVNRVYGDKPGGLIVDRWAWLISWPMRWRRTPKPAARARW